jgi:hypothetical protein
MMVRRSLWVCIAALCLASLIAVPTSAEAHAYRKCAVGVYTGPFWGVGGSSWCHLHTLYYYFFNGADFKGGGVARDAQIDWHQQTTLDLSSSSHADSRIHHDDAYVADPAIYGFSAVCAHGCVQHTYTNDYVEFEKSFYDWRAVACHEIGHAVGQDHHSGGCMGIPQNPPWFDRISSHMKYETNDY